MRKDLKTIQEIRELLYKGAINEDQALELMREIRRQEKKPTS
jgi:hypothetical protein